MKTIMLIAMSCSLGLIFSALTLAITAIFDFDICCDDNSIMRLVLGWILVMVSILGMLNKYGVI